MAATHDPDGIKLFGTGGWYNIMISIQFTDHRRRLIHNVTVEVTKCF